jgi:general secretion pathway protein K
MARFDALAARRPRRPRREHGAALLLALMLVALVATLGSAMLWQQWRAVQVEGAGRARAQAAWILGGATDWARLIMREDARTSSTDHAAEPWATPLAEDRLSSFLAVDRERSSEVELEAFLSGSIADAQARYNLRNLVDAATGQAVTAEVEAFERLCAFVGLGAEVAPRIVQGLRAAWGPAGRGGDEATRPLPPSQLEHLAWLGVDVSAIEALRPHATLLPRKTPLNLNTAGREVLAAVLDVDAGSAERLVQRRQLRAFDNLEQARAELPSRVDLAPARLAVASSHFVVSGRLRLDERVLEETAWLRREGSGVVVERRQRQSALAAAP